MGKHNELGAVVRAEARDLVTVGERPEHTARQRTLQHRDHPDRIAARQRRASIERRLWARQRAETIVHAWDALTDWEANFVADVVATHTLASSPLPAFTTVRAEAESWAAIASVHELKVYVAAAVTRFFPADRASLTAYLARLG